jgi:pre-mRNA-processing factor 6
MASVEVSTTITTMLSLHLRLCTYFIMVLPACCTARQVDRAREYYQKGLRRCSSSVPLWRLAGRLEERLHGVTKARSMFELARLKNQKNPELWLEAIRLERRAGNEKLAVTLMAKALQECPASGLLWAEEIITSPRPQQKSKSQEALTKCQNDSLVFCAVARLFEATRKYAKARKWYNQAVELNPDIGDHWAYFYAFEVRHGGEDERAAVLKRCLEADPTHGELWTSVSKQVENWRVDKETILKKVGHLVFSTRRRARLLLAACAQVAVMSCGLDRLNVPDGCVTGAKRREGLWLFYCLCS